MFFEYHKHPGKKLWASRFLIFIGYIFSKLIYKTEVEVAQGITFEGPTLILGKHSSDSDIPLGYLAVKNLFQRHPWCIMKASLAEKKFLGFFWKMGGIPLDREHPERSKDMLLYAKKILYNLDISGLKAGDGNIFVIFPEETRIWQKMGEGQVAGFRFITGKPVVPLNVVCVGFEYIPRLFRTKVVMRFGPSHFYSKEDDPGVFLYERMCELARLSNLPYDFPRPEPRRRSSDALGAGD